jgi:hypothetical protein
MRWTAVSDFEPPTPAFIERIDKHLDDAARSGMWRDGL